MSYQNIKTSIFIAVCLFLIQTSFAQSAIEYRHAPEASRQSRFLERMFKMVGVKKDRKKGNDKNSMTRIRPISRIHRRYKLEKLEQQGRAVYNISPKKEGRGLKIIYLHGGAYTANFLKQHWQFMSKLIDETGATVLAPDYPLAPKATYKENIPFVLALYQNALKTHSADSLIFIGDSAGGGLALALAMAVRDAGLPQPGKIIMISPWLDLGMENPEIPALEKQDPMLNLKGIKRSALAYSGDSSAMRNPWVSPIYGDLKGLGALSLFIGGRDVLQADTEKFKAICAAENIPLNYYFYPNMVHVWMLVPFLPESEVATAQIIKIIKNAATDEKR